MQRPPPPIGPRSKHPFGCNKNPHPHKPQSQLHIIMLQVGKAANSGPNHRVLGRWRGLGLQLRVKISGRQTQMAVVTRCGCIPITATGKSEPLHLGQGSSSSLSSSSSSSSSESESSRVKGTCRRGCETLLATCTDWYPRIPCKQKYTCALQ